MFGGLLCARRKIAIVDEHGLRRSMEQVRAHLTEPTASWKPLDRATVEVLVGGKV